jgi:hypothetical protein
MNNLNYNNKGKERRDDGCAATAKINMNMSIGMTQRLIAMTVMSTATKTRCILMSTPTTMGIMSTGTLVAIKESHDPAKELSHEGPLRSEDWKMSVRGFPFSFFSAP